MTELGALETRVEGLEARIAYQDQTIEEMSAVLTAQWREIETLTRQLARLAEAVDDARRGPARDPASEPPPPHY